VTILTSFFSFLIVFSAMVFVHEFGHYIVGKLAGVRVREFGFGLPLGAEKPPSERPLTWMFWKDKSGTAYTWNLIPFGGFVNLGENDPNDPTSLANFPKRVRLATLLAGPLMNVVAAFVIFVATAMLGYPQVIWGIGIGEVVEGSPAAAIGLQANDIILGINDLSFTPSEDVDYVYNTLIKQMVDYTAENPGRTLTVQVQRGIGQDAQQFEIEIVPQPDQEGKGKMGVLISPVPVRVRRVHASLWEGIQYGVAEIVYVVRTTISLPVQVIQGLVSPAVARPVGPVGIARMTGDATQQSIDTGWAFPILNLAGLLNVAIAITNLLPIPALDGGRIVFILLEAIRGKPVPPEKEGLVHGIGLMVLLLLFVLITVQDIFMKMPEMFNWADYLY